MLKRGVVVDATLVESSRHPRKVLEMEAVPEADGADGRIEYKAKSDEAKVSCSADVEAGWTVKGGRPAYGYKVHGVVDEAHGFILGGHATAGQVSDTTELPQVLEEADGVPFGAIVGADKGYDSKANRDYLALKAYPDGIMRKAQRNKPLSEENKKRNAAISKTRWIVERSFGTLKKGNDLSGLATLAGLKWIWNFTFKPWLTMSEK